MSNLKRDIDSKDWKICDIINQLKEDNWLIPTFQREFVWSPENILKLWDSIYRFYPIGSMLYWETDTYLHTHRKLGGFIFPNDEDTLKKYEKWKYILDGQQRATSLLVSFLGGTGRVEGNEKFDYTLYFDLVAGQFFFAGDLDERKKEVNSSYLIRVKDVPDWRISFYKQISAVEGYNDAIEHNIEQISRLFTDYKISVVKVKGVTVNEVCEIFERINQEGKKLHPVDIIVARTYRVENKETGQKAFYLRDNLSELKEVLIEQGSKFQNVDDLTIIQMVALCLRKKVSSKRSPFGITPAALDNLKAEHFEENWEKSKKTIYNTIKFMSDMKVSGPGMLPFVYLALPLCYYMHENKSINKKIARQWFWRTAFALDEFRSSTVVYDFCEDFFAKVEKGAELKIPSLEISKTRLIKANYNYRNSLSRAVLAFLANQNPIDFSDQHAPVLDNIYLLLSQAPNLHHIYPLNFLKKISNLPDGADANSLMNICFLRAVTNIKIGDKNPLTYFENFENEVDDFDKILETHLIPKEFLERSEFTASDYKDFLDTRAQWFAEKLRDALPDVVVTITD